MKDYSNTRIMTREQAEHAFRVLSHLSHPGEVPPGYEDTRPEDIKGLMPAHTFDAFLAANKIQISEELK